MHENSRTLTWQTFFSPDSRDLPRTLVSSFCKSGLSASEDTDHISKKRGIEAYRPSSGDGQGAKEGERENIRTGGHVEPIHMVGDLILRVYSDRQAIISGYYVRMGMDT